MVSEAGILDVIAVNCGLGEAGYLRIEQPYSKIKSIADFDSHSHHSCRSI